MKNLKYGISTGGCAYLAFIRAFEAFLKTNSFTKSTIIKPYNDDIDATIGAKIIVEISYNKSELKINKIPHNPIKKNNFFIYAGYGAGVVTKSGLKVEPNYPAINPSPLKAILNLIKHKFKKKVFCTISVENGLKLAKKTANKKVGIYGGISILGTKGIVKPISNEAYLSSIESEISFFTANKKEFVFSVGNSAKEQVKKLNLEYIEIGNFIYDSYKLAKKYKTIPKLFIPIAKLTKLSLGAKNTNSRYGGIDFKKLQKMFDFRLNGNSVREIYKNLDFNQKKIFEKSLITLAKKNLFEWLNIKVDIILV